MGKPQFLTTLTDRIRSGAIWTASQRDLRPGTGRITSARDFGATPTRTASYGSSINQQRTSARRVPLTRAPLSTHKEQSQNIDVEKGLYHGQQSPSAADAQPQDTQAQTETGPAIGEDGNGAKPAAKPKISFGQRLRRSPRRFWMHTKNALMHSWVNVLLIFVPIGIAAAAAHLNPAVVFALNAVAIVPLAGLLTMATESVAGRLGDTWGALLNVSFGNAVELIIFIIGLVKNEIRIVQAALLGSLLANLLLILGMAFVLGGLRYREQIYNSTVTQLSACLLSLSVMSLLLPTAFHASFEDDKTADKATIKMSRGVSVILLCVYGLYLLFQLKSHSYLYQSMSQEQIDEETEPAFLHDMLDPDSSSSSSSSSSDSDSDTTQTTRKRIKRAFTSRKRRKSSAATSNKEQAQISKANTAEHLPLDEIAVTHESSRSENHESETNKSETDIKTPESKPEAPLEVPEKSDPQTDNGSGSRPPTVRDFQYYPEPDPSPDLLVVPESQIPSPASPKHKSRKSRRREQREERRERRQRRLQRLQGDHALSGAELAAAHQVGFAEDTQQQEPSSSDHRPAPGGRRSFFKPPLPKLFSENVFVQPIRPSELMRLPSQQKMPGALRRARSNLHRVSSRKEMRMASYARNNNSSPNLSRGTPSVDDIGPVSAIPGRGLQPSVLPIILRRKVTEPKSEGAVTEHEDEGEDPEMSRLAAVVLLLASTALVAICAEFLVDAIPQMTANSTVSQAFIGLIILPIVGNAAEHVTAVTVAMKNKMDLAIGVALGSSIQISLFITPLVIIIGWILDKSMSLYFTLFETISLFVTAFVVNFLVLDGRSNYLEGTLLMAAYIIIAIAAFYYPDSADASALGGTPRNHTSSSEINVVQMMLRF